MQDYSSIVVVFLPKAVTFAHSLSLFILPDEDRIKAAFKRSFNAPRSLETFFVLLEGGVSNYVEPRLRRYILGKFQGDDHIRRR